MRFRHIFFRFFRNCRAFGRASMRTAAALHCRGARVQGSDGVHWCPSKCPTVSKKSKKNVPELHLAAIFCEKRSETVAKHRVTWSKITPFRLAIPKMAGVWEKKVEIFVFFGGLGLSDLRILLSYFWASPITPA